MEELEQKIKKTSVKSGLLLGVTLLALSIFAFYFITIIATSGGLILFGPIVISVIIPIVFVVFFCIDLRKKIGGYWNFKQATTGIFIMFIIAYAVQIIGRDAIFANVVEPQMVEKTQIAVKKATTSVLEKAGANQTQIDIKIAEIQKEFDAQKTVTTAKIIQSYAISIIFVFVFALIFGAIFKKDYPVYLTQQDDEADTGPVV